MCSGSAIPAYTTSVTDLGVGYPEKRNTINHLGDFLDSLENGPGEYCLPHPNDVEDRRCS